MVKDVDQNASPSGTRSLGEVKDGRSDLATICVEYNPGQFKVSKGSEEVVRQKLCHLMSSRLVGNQSSSG